LKTDNREQADDYGSAVWRFTDAGQERRMRKWTCSLLKSTCTVGGSVVESQKQEGGTVCGRGPHRERKPEQGWVVVVGRKEGRGRKRPKRKILSGKGETENREASHSAARELEKKEGRNVKTSDKLLFPNNSRKGWEKMGKQGCSGPRIKRRRITTFPEKGGGGGAKKGGGCGGGALSVYRAEVKRTRPSSRKTEKEIGEKECCRQ